MEKIAQKTFSQVCKYYFSLSKPGIIFGNGVASIGGFALASQGSINFSLFFFMFLGLSFIIASACVLNNYIDREIDAKMQRTKNRVLVKKLIPIKHAMLYAFLLFLCGSCILLIKTHILPTILSWTGFFIYVFLYSFLKHFTSYATIIGSFAGAMPPIVGYSAALEKIDLGAFILFAIFALWQMPHFFAIALYRVSDYKAASIPVLPIKKGVKATKTQMLLYIIAFIGASFCLTCYNYCGLFFLLGISSLGLMWIVLCVKGYRCKNDQIWSRQMFIFSLIIVMAVSLFISLPLP